MNDGKLVGIVERLGGLDAQLGDTTVMGSISLRWLGGQSGRGRGRGIDDGAIGRRLALDGRRRLFDRPDLGSIGTLPVADNGSQRFAVD